MHKEELTDVIKDLFGDFTESEYFDYFITRFPRLLFHCYNSVETEAKDLFTEYFLEEKTSAVKPAPTVIKPQVILHGYDSQDFTLLIDCKRIIEFPAINVQLQHLIIKDISHFFSVNNTSFTRFLQKNGSPVTEIRFSGGFLKFDSLKKILQELPNLRNISFDEVNYDAPKTNPKVQLPTCQNLFSVDIVNVNSGVHHAFPERNSVETLTLKNPKGSFVEIGNTYLNLKKLSVVFNQTFSVNFSKILIGTTCQLDELDITKYVPLPRKLEESFVEFIKTQNNLQKIYYYDTRYSKQSESLFEKFAAHILKIKRLTWLQINSNQLGHGVSRYVENCKEKNTNLKELTCYLWQFESSTFLDHFTNLDKLEFLDQKISSCVFFEDVIGVINKSKLTSIKFQSIFSDIFKKLCKLRLETLQDFHVDIADYSSDQKEVFLLLPQLLENCPNIRNFKMEFNKEYSKSSLDEVDMIQMIVKRWSKLESLNIRSIGYKMKPESIEEIEGLKKLKYWKINGYDSETFDKDKSVVESD